MHKAIDRVFRKATAVLSLIAPAIARAAETVTPEQWQQLTSDKAFDYRNLKEAAQRPQNSNPGIFAKFFQGLFGFFGSGLGNLLLWILVLAIVGFILYSVFISKDSFLFGKERKKMRDDDAGTPNEDDIASTDWEELSQQAIKSGDMRLAVRYSYMWLLRLLQQENLINYRIDKTNYDYYSELNETPYKQPFRQLSRQYEYVWYGQYPISDAAFSGYLEQFNQLKKQLQQ